MQIYMPYMAGCLCPPLNSVYAVCLNCQYMYIFRLTACIHNISYTSRLKQVIVFLHLAYAAIEVDIKF